MSYSKELLKKRTTDRQILDKPVLQILQKTYKQIKFIEPRENGKILHIYLRSADHPLKDKQIDEIIKRLQR